MISPDDPEVVACNGPTLRELREASIDVMMEPYRQRLGEIEVEVLSELEKLVAIAQSVAALETPFDDLDCHFCGVYRYHANARDSIEITIEEHEDDCPWRLAVVLFPEIASRSGE